MKKEYLTPELEVQKFSFESILGEEATTPSGVPIEETVPSVGGGEVDPGEEW